MVAALPYGKLPVLEVDGTVIPQSTSQLRYVGKIGGLYPTDPLEAALADAAVGATMDIFIPMAAAFNEKDDERKVRLSVVREKLYNLGSASRFVAGLFGFPAVFAERRR